MHLHAGTWQWDKPGCSNDGNCGRGRILTCSPPSAALCSVRRQFATRSAPPIPCYRDECAERSAGYLSWKCIQFDRTPIPNRDEDTPTFQLWPGSATCSGNFLSFCPSWQIFITIKDTQVNGIWILLSSLANILFSNLTLKYIEYLKTDRSIWCRVSDLLNLKCYLSFAIPLHINEHHRLLHFL